MDATSRAIGNCTSVGIVDELPHISLVWIQQDPEGAAKMRAKNLMASLEHSKRGISVKIIILIKI